MKNKMKVALTALSMAALLVIALSCKAEVEADTTAPATVTNVAATAGDGKVVLTWSDPADSDLYGVRVSYTSAGGASGNIRAAFADGVLVAKGAQTYIVTGLTNGTEYTFSVYAVDTSQNESAAATASATPTDSSDTMAPSDVTGLSATNKDASVVLTWTDATADDIYGYEVSWNGTGAINRAATSTAVATGSMIVAQGAGGCYISNLVNGTSYTFTVKSVDTSGNKSTGVTKTITPEAIDSGTTLGISLKADTTAATNGDVTVTVTVTSADSIKTVAYKNSVVASASALFALGEYSATNTSGYTTLTATNGTYTFTVSANGTFTAASLDTAGREECAYITVSNIDKTAPAKITNLAASYSAANSAITVTWTDPSDSDVDHIVFTYAKGSDSATEETVAKGMQTYTLSNVTEPDVTYTFTAVAKDTTGNTAEAATATLTTTTGPSISTINLSRTHIASTATDKTITVTVNGSNFDTIASQSDTTLKVQVLDSSSTVQSTTTATVDTTANTATATITAPTPSTPTAAGTTYTVRVKLCGTAVTTPTKTFIVSLPAAVTGITLGTTQIALSNVTATTVTAVNVTGTNLDIADSPVVVELFASDGTAEDSYKTTVPASDIEATAFSCSVAAPLVSGIHTAKVLFNGTAQTKTATIQVYDVPSFTKVSIPYAGTSKEDNALPIVITGANFTAPGVTASSFTFSCVNSSGATASGVVSGTAAEIVSDTMITANLVIPGTADTYTVTVTCGSNSKDGTLTVKDYSGWAVGDIMGADGTTRLAVADTSAATVTSTFTSTVPAAVICGFNSLGAAVGVGLKQSGSLQWAPSGTTGYNTYFTAIQSGCSGSSGSYTFTGDLYGGDNWTAVCKADGTAADNAATNYPVFNYANTYASSAATNLIGTACADGWYVPSISELSTLYTNKSTVDTSIGYVSGGIQVGTSMIWSSSQYSGAYYVAWVVNFSDGDVYYDVKKFSKYVRVIRAF